MKIDDLISRKAALDALKEVSEHYTDKGREWHPHVDFMVQAIEELPSVQPEVIRCKDCENWIPGYITDNDDLIPPKCGKYQQMVGHSSSDYCSLAERREDE